MTTQDKIGGRRIGVMGMAKSGVAAALLGKRGSAHVFVSDSAPEYKLTDAVATLRKNEIAFETGGHTERLLSSDYLVVSPGVPSEIPIIKEAESKGVPMFSEIEFASWVCPAKICAITGSNGKTTTTTLIGAMLIAGGKNAVVCGNIGNPFADLADKLGAEDVAVLEISSFQLERIEKFHPNVALILNVTPDHLDRYESFEHYKNTKYRIAENLEKNDNLIVNLDDAETNADKIETNATIQFFASSNDDRASALIDNGQIIIKKSNENIRVLAASEVLIPGPHNLQNALAAAAAVNCFDVAPQAMAEVLRSFKGVEHRLELAGKVAGISFINDSKATNVDSVCWAIKSFDRPIYLIAGGRHKGAGYAPIGKLGKGKIKGVVAIGEAKEIVFEDLGHQFPVQFADTLEDAVQMTFDMAIPGDIVLLSPGCASFDMFDNFEHRGRVFKKAVASLKNGKEKDETVIG